MAFLQTTEITFLSPNLRKGTPGELLCSDVRMVFCMIIHSLSLGKRLANSHRNPGGVRFGSAELYEVIDGCFADAIEDYIAIAQTIDNGTDERVILFVKLLKDQELSPTLIDAIRAQIREKRTPRHVPSKVSYLLLIRS